MPANKNPIEEEIVEEEQEELAEQRFVNFSALGLIGMTAVFLVVGYNWFVYMGYIGQN